MSNMVGKANESSLPSLATESGDETAFRRHLKGIRRTNPIKIEDNAEI